MNEALKISFLKTTAQVGLMQAITKRLIAINKGDETAAAEQAQFEARFRNVIADINARGTVRKFAHGTQIELRATSEDGKVAGWASTPDLDTYRHTVVNGAFSQAIAERGLTGPTAIKLLLDHDVTKPAGVITKLEYRSKGLWIEADLDLDIEYVRDRYSIMKKLLGFNFSVGFILQDADVKKDAEKEDYLQINRGDLFEVSLVAFPANEAAQAITVKSQPAPSNAAAKLQQLLDQMQALNRTLKAH